MKQQEHDRLAHKMALYAAKSILGSYCHRAIIQGETWRHTGDLSVDRPEARTYVIEAIVYLDAAGILEHHPQKHHLVRWDEA